MNHHDLSGISKHLSAIREWQSHGDDYGEISGDALAPVISKAFDLLHAVSLPNYEHANVERSVIALANDLQEVMANDEGNDPRGILIFGLLQSMNTTFQAVTEKFKRFEEALASSSSTSVADDINNFSLQPTGHVDMDVYREIKEESSSDESEIEVTDNQENEYPITPSSRPSSNRPKRGAAQSIDYVLLSGGARRGTKRLKRYEEEEGSEDEVPPRPPRPPPTAAQQCPFCETRPTTIGGFQSHLKKWHSITLLKSGYSLLCACGKLLESEAAIRHHNSRLALVSSRKDISAKYMCDGRTFIVKKDAESGEDDEEEELEARDYHMADEEYTSDDEEEEESEGNDSSHATAQCFICEARPTSINGFFLHLKKSHGTSLRKSGYSLKCGCGCLLTSYWTIRHHNSKTMCLGRSFHLKRETYGEDEESEEEESDGELEDDDEEEEVEDEEEEEEEDEIDQQGEDKEEEEENEDERNEIEEEDNEDIAGPSTTPQCMLCEVHPITISSYVNHVKSKHKTTLRKQGYVIECSCGFRVYSDHTLKQHKSKRQCTGSSFRLEKRAQRMMKRVKEKEKDENEGVEQMNDDNEDMREESIMICEEEGEEEKEEEGEEEKEDEEGVEEGKREDSFHKNRECFLCKVRPSTIRGFFSHVKMNHKSSVRAEGYSLECECGLLFQRAKTFESHCRETTCKGRSFSVKNQRGIGEKEIKSANSGPFDFSFDL